MGPVCVFRVCWEEQHREKGKPPSPAETLLKAARKGQKKPLNNTPHPEISPVLPMGQDLQLPVSLTLNIPT